MRPRYNSGLDDLLRDYGTGDDDAPYWYSGDGLIVCTLMSYSGVWGLGSRTCYGIFDGMIGDSDYLKLKPSIREVVERTFVV